jgi:hypothetical protein
MTVTIADAAAGIAADDTNWLVLASFVLADNAAELAELYAGQDLSTLTSQQGRRQLVDALVSKLREPGASPTVAFALGKARRLSDGEVAELVGRLRSSVELDDEEFVYQRLIALDSHNVELDAVLLARLESLASERITYVVTHGWPRR